jgi:hypothetical protein
MTPSAIICFDNVTKRFGDLVVLDQFNIGMGEYFMSGPRHG